MAKTGLNGGKNKTMEKASLSISPTTDDQTPTAHCSLIRNPGRAIYTFFVSQLSLTALKLSPYLCIYNFSRLL